MPSDDVDSTLSETLACLDAAEEFLRQQRELYGNIIYSSQSAAKAAPAKTEAATIEPAGEDRIHPSRQVHEPPPVKQKSRTTEAPHPAAGRAAVAPLPAKPSPSTGPGVPDTWPNAVTLRELNTAICTCTKCVLGATRTKFVFGVGRPDSGVMVIGEAPGADEDEQGEPFVGKAGQLLNKILEAVQFAREDVFIANILKCRPPNNRKPLPAEVELCEPYLWKQIELVKPKIILCLGLTAAQTLLKSTSSLGALRESVHMYRGIPLIVTYHPAALLRNPNWKKPTWEDVQKFKKMYDDITAAG